MARPKKVQAALVDTLYCAKEIPLEADMDMATSANTDEAINYLKECEGNVEELYLYEIKLIGKFRAKYSLEKID